MLLGLFSKYKEVDYFHSLYLQISMVTSPVIGLVVGSEPFQHYREWIGIGKIEISISDMFYQ